MFELEPGCCVVGLILHRRGKSQRISARAHLYVHAARVHVSGSQIMMESQVSCCSLSLLKGPVRVRPHHACVPLSERRQHRPVRSTCRVRLHSMCAPRHSAPTRSGVCKSRNSFADALFTQGLMALVPPIICCVKAQSAREFVTEFSGGATPHRSGVAQS